jgi:hypothetical protein
MAAIADELLKKEEVGPLISFYTGCPFSVIYTYSIVCHTESEGRVPKCSSCLFCQSPYSKGKFTPKKGLEKGLSRC